MEMRYLIYNFFYEKDEQYQTHSVWKSWKKLRDIISDRFRITKTITQNSECRLHNSNCIPPAPLSKIPQKLH